jgi:hypothetical protein
MSQDKVVKIDAFAEGVWRSRDYEAIVCVDVITAGTTLVTSMAQGRRTFCLPRIEPTAGPREWLRTNDVELSTGADDDDVLGPRDLDQRTDTERPLALRSMLSELLGGALFNSPLYIACLRNLSATVTHLAGHHDRVAIVAAGMGGEARFEDEMAAAWIAADLRGWGFIPDDRATALAIDRWTRGEVGLIGLGKSAEALRTRGFHRDLAFILGHVDDVRIPCRMNGQEVAVAGPRSERADHEEPARVPESGLARLRAS